MNLYNIAHTPNMESNVSIGEKSSINTLTALPPPSSPLITIVSNPTPLLTHSPIYDGILRQPITILFSSQSTDPSTDQAIYDSQHMDNEDKGGFHFGALTFYLNEENIEDEDLMYGKLYKIFNIMINMIL